MVSVTVAFGFPMRTLGVMRALSAMMRVLGDVMRALGLVVR